MFVHNICLHIVFKDFHVILTSKVQKMNSSCLACCCDACLLPYLLHAIQRGYLCHSSFGYFPSPHLQELLITPGGQRAARARASSRHWAEATDLKLPPAHSGTAQWGRSSSHSWRWEEPSPASVQLPLTSSGSSPSHFHSCPCHSKL